MIISNGTVVSIHLDNGYKATGVIVRRFKNGRYGVREANGTYYVRCSQDVLPLNKAACGPMKEER